MASKTKFEIEASVKGKEEVFEFVKAVDGAYVAVNKYNDLAGRGLKVNGKLVKTLNDYNQAVNGFKSAQNSATQTTKVASDAVKDYTKEAERLLKVQGEMGKAKIKNVFLGDKKITDEAKLSKLGYAKAIDEIIKKASQLSSSLAKAGNASIGVGKGVKSVVGVLTKATISTVNTVSAIAADMYKSIRSRVSSAIASIVKEALDFSTVMARVNTLLDDTSDSMIRMHEVARLAGEYGMSTTEAANAYLYAVSGGLKELDESLDTTEASMKLSVATGSKLTSTLKAMVGAQNAYGRETYSTARISDIFFSGLDYGITTMDEMATAFGNVASIAANTNVSLEELIGTTSQSTRIGMPTSTAWMGVRNVLASMISPTQQASKSTKALGFEMGAAKLEALGYQGMVNELNEKVGGTAGQLAAFSKNVRTSSSLLSISGRNLRDYNRIQNAVTNSAGRANRAYEIMNKTLEYQGRTFYRSLRAGAVVGLQSLFEVLGNQLSQIDRKDLFTNAKNAVIDFQLVALKAFKVILIGAEKLVDYIDNDLANAWQNSSGPWSFFFNMFDERMKLSKEELSTLEEKAKEVFEQKYGRKYDDSYFSFDTEKLDKIKEEILPELKKGFEENRKENSKFATSIKTLDDLIVEYSGNLENFKNINYKPGAGASFVSGAIDEAQKGKSTLEKFSEKYQEVLKDLEMEERLLNATSLQKEIYNRLEEAGVELKNKTLDANNDLITSDGTRITQYDVLIEKVKALYAAEENALVGWDNQIATIREFGAEYKSSMLSVKDVLMNAFQNTEDAIIDFCKTGKSSFSDMVNSMIEDLARLMIQQQLAGLASLISGSIGTSGGVNFGSESFAKSVGRKPVMQASGGLITGPGTGTSDSIPAWLSNGEFVMNAQATAKYLPLLKQMNENKFASGGLVGNARGYNNNVDIQVIDQRGANAAPIQTQQSEGPDGRKMIKMMIRDTVKQGFASGAYDSSMRNTYGIRRSAYSR